MSGKKYIYLFAAGKAEGQGAWRNLLGGKGAGLAEMTNLGIPVPPGFTITTEACVEYFHNGGHFPEGMWNQAVDALATVESAMGMKFGDPRNPLLVSVRSGARVSMALRGSAPGESPLWLGYAQAPRARTARNELTNLVMTASCRKRQAL